MNKIVIICLLVAVVVGAIVLGWPRADKPTQTAGAIRMPTNLSASAQGGMALFEANCAACHGAAATGTHNGPPLVHRIYEPNHHGDGAFFSAVFRGARAHHWRFGDMPPVAGVSEQDVVQIIAYVRALQRANGIN